jgi:hypothetical protein
MKKIILIVGLVLVSLVGYSQADWVAADSLSEVVVNGNEYEEVKSQLTTIYKGKIFKPTTDLTNTPKDVRDWFLSGEELKRKDTWIFMIPFNKKHIALNDITNRYKYSTIKDVGDKKYFTFFIEKTEDGRYKYTTLFFN